MNRTDARAERWILPAAFLLAMTFTGFHVVRAARNAIYWNGHRDEPIEGWMTLGYDARSCHVPRHILFLALGMDPGPPERRNIVTIAAAQGRSVDEVALELNNAVVRARPPYPKPGPPPSATGKANAG